MQLFQNEGGMWQVYWNHLNNTVYSQRKWWHRHFCATWQMLK